MSKKVLFFVLIFMVVVPYAQVSFTSMPVRMHFYPRNAPADTGIATIAGSVTTSGANYTSMRLKVYRSGTLQSTLNQNLTPSGTNASFSFKYGIKAELAMYKFEVLGVNNTTETPLRTADSVVCGDVFIIQGQSNAEAHSFSGSAGAYNSPFIRVCGFATATTDTLWRIGQGDGAQNTVGNTGQWGLVFAKLIVDNQKIPVAIFNGCASGTAISNFTRNNTTPDNTSSNYGRLLTRLKKTGLTSSVKAIFWFQGEQNANDGTSTSAYKTAFTTLLQKGWLVDYPNVKKTYIFQIGSGCNTSGKAAATYAEYVNQIKAAHRELGEELTDVETMSSSGSDHYNDNGACCHHPFVNGYEPFGKNAYWLLARDFYGKNADNIDAPNIKFAEISGTQEITLIMKNIIDSLTWNSGSEAYFRLEGSSAKVNSGKVSGNKIILTLSASPSSATGISYLGHGGATSNPLVRNLNGIGAVHFYKFSLTTARFRDSVCVAAILKSNAITLPVDSVVSYSGQRITALQLSGRNIATLPADIGYMDSLKTINVSGNILPTLPREIAKLSPSVSLNINTNRLCQISDTLTTWITKYSKDIAWKTTQMLDATHACSGTGVLFASASAAYRSIFVKSMTSQNQMVINFRTPSDIEQVLIFRADGKLMAKVTAFSKALTIDTGTFGNGLFFMRVKTHESVVTEKLLLM